MELETQLYIAAGVLGGVCLLLLILVIVLFSKVGTLSKKVEEMQATGRLRIQKLKMNGDKSHAFHNPALTPDEELSKRGYSMYQTDEREADVESQRGRERQSGPTFVEELTRELDHRQKSAPPPFLLQAIQENKKNRQFNNPVANDSRVASETNPNFIY